MLMWAAIFLIIAIIAGLFGFGGVASAATQIAKILFVVFLILFVVSLVYHFFSRATESMKEPSPQLNTQPATPSKPASST